jgi:NAD(P)-dependent dehydrogenase (short-subunit alcohol dehydrogenase family)
MRTWFITGASRGFGALIAEQALQAGDNVIATARSPETVTARLGEHPRLLAVKLDVTDETQVFSAVEQGIKKFGRLDLVVNNAGYGLLGAVEEANHTEIENLFKTNVFGVLAVSRAALPHMRRQGSGHIINISSIGAVQAYVGWGVYGATKFAVEGLTEAMAQELAPLGIHATVVQPGFFRTDQTAGAMRDLAKKYNHAQPGDPQKLAEAIYQLSLKDKPPVRLPLGSDTVALIREKTAAAPALLGQWLSLSLSTDHAVD